MNFDPDMELVRLCQAGDTSAFDELVNKHKDRIYRLAYKMLGGEYEVDDVTQEVFLKVYRSIGKFRYQSSFSTWLTQIAVNHCMNYLKSQRKFKLLPSGLFSKRSSVVSPQAMAERNEKCERVCRAINDLPLKQKAVIIMYYFEDYSCEEIAEIMNCSVGTVKSRLFYARMELKKQLKSYLEDGNWIDNSIVRDA